MYAFGNGEVDDEWEKQRFIKILADQAFSVFKHITRTNDIGTLKDLLFKVAECSKTNFEDSKRAHVTSYREQEQFEHSSIFVNKHLLHSGDAKYEDYYGTLSSTLLMFTDTNVFYMFERIYDHSRMRSQAQLYEDERLLEYFLALKNPRLRTMQCTHESNYLSDQEDSQVYKRENLKRITEGGYSGNNYHRPSRG